MLALQNAVHDVENENQSRKSERKIFTNGKKSLSRTINPIKMKYKVIFENVTANEFGNSQINTNISEIFFLFL